MEKSKSSKKFKVGDTVRVLKVQHPNIMGELLGTEFEIGWISSIEPRIYSHPDGWVFSADELELLQENPENFVGISEENQKDFEKISNEFSKKFKVGDKVRVIGVECPSVMNDLMETEFEIAAINKQTFERPYQHPEGWVFSADELELVQAKEEPVVCTKEQEEFLADLEVFKERGLKYLSGVEYYVQEEGWRNSIDSLEDLYEYRNDPGLIEYIQKKPKTQTLWYCIFKSTVTGSFVTSPLYASEKILKDMIAIYEKEGYTVVKELKEEVQV